MSMDWMTPELLGVVTRYLKFNFSKTCRLLFHVYDYSKFKDRNIDVIDVLLLVQTNK